MWEEGGQHHRGQRRVAVVEHIRWSRLCNLQLAITPPPSTTHPHLHSCLGALNPTGWWRALSQAHSAEAGRLADDSTIEQRSAFWRAPPEEVKQAKQRLRRQLEDLYIKVRVVGWGGLKGQVEGCCHCSYTTSASRWLNNKNCPPSIPLPLPARPVLAAAAVRPAQLP